MDDTTFQIAGSISRLDAEFLKAQKIYNGECTHIARNQKKVSTKLLELAPKELRRKIQLPLHRLMAYKQTTFHINAAGDARSASKAKLLSELARAWEEVVAVEVEINKKGNRFRLYVHLFAL